VLQPKDYTGNVLLVVGIVWALAAGGAIYRAARGKVSGLTAGEMPPGHPAT
jgi:hypothetical protein